MLLKELTNKENHAYAYFKGGTALYKALKSVRRFSEDIDLTIYVDDCPSFNQAKKRLENSVLKFTSLEKGRVLDNRRGSITCEYLYEPQFIMNSKQHLPNIGQIKIEATSFTISEPAEELLIAPHIYEVASIEQKKMMEEVFDIKPFPIATVTLERIFMDKVFATEFYYERKMYRDVSKHLYDITILLRNEKILTFLKNQEHFNYVLHCERKEQSIRKGGVPNDLRIHDFAYFKELKKDEQIKKEFDYMQNIYVYNPIDHLKVNDVFKTLDTLYKRMLDLEVVSI